MTVRTLTARLSPLLLALVLVLTGCDSTDSGMTDDSGDVVVTAEETAESVAVAVSQETGGTTDDVADVAEFAEELTAKDFSSTFSRECTFDDANVWWTCAVDASRQTDRRSQTYTRTARVQFFDADGNPKPNYRSGGVAAASLQYTILDGNGTYDGPRLSSEHTVNLDPETPSSWTVDGVDGDTFVINGSGSRSHSDSLKYARTQRTRFATNAATLSDIVWMRGSGIDSGTISGTHTAEVTETRNGQTRTRSVTVDYTATFENGVVTVTLSGSGERFNGQSFTFDAMTGEAV